jgi:hypothetical protein
LYLGRFKREETESKAARIDWRLHAGNDVTSVCILSLHQGCRQIVAIEQGAVDPYPARPFMLTAGSCSAGTRRCCAPSPGA